VLLRGHHETGFDLAGEPFLRQALQSRQFRQSASTSCAPQSASRRSVWRIRSWQSRVSSSCSELDLRRAQPPGRRDLPRSWLGTDHHRRAGDILVASAGLQPVDRSHGSRDTLMRAVLREGKGGIQARGVDGVTRFYPDSHGSSAWRTGAISMSPSATQGRGACRVDTQGQARLRRDSHSSHSPPFSLPG